VFALRSICIAHIVWWYPFRTFYILLYVSQLVTITVTMSSDVTDCVTVWSCHSNPSYKRKINQKENWNENENNQSSLLLTLISQVVALWTTYVGICLFLFYLTTAPCYFHMYTQSAPHIVVEAFLLFFQEYYMYFSLLIGIYSYKYYFVSLHFTNWPIFYSYSNLCLSCNLSQAKIITRMIIIKWLETLIEILEWIAGSAEFYRVLQPLESNKWIKWELLRVITILNTNRVYSNLT